MVQGQSQRAAQAGDPSYDDQPPAGEIETVSRIKAICWLGRKTAELVAEHKASGEPIGDYQSSYDRYHRQRGEAADLADTLTDEFCRNAATLMLCGLCMTARDEKAGRALFDLIKIDFMREEALTEFPQLGGPPLSDVIRDNK